MGAKCSRKYFEDWKRRTTEFGPENQGTGDLCADLEDIARRMGIEAKASPSSCLELCPLPWERSMVIDPSGVGHEAYYGDLPDLIRNWDASRG